jgi:hypothetical protein
MPFSALSQRTTTDILVELELRFMRGAPNYINGFGDNLGDLLR